MVKVLLVNFCVVSKRANRELHFTNQPFYIWLETLETHNCIYFNIPTTCTHPQVIHQQPSASPTSARQLSSYPVSPTGGHPSPRQTNNCTPLSCCPFFATQSSKFFLFFYSIPIILGQRFLDLLILTPDYNLPRTFQRAWTRKHQMFNWFVLV